MTPNVSALTVSNSIADTTTTTSVWSIGRTSNGEVSINNSETVGAKISGGTSGSYASTGTHTVSSTISFQTNGISLTTTLGRGYAEWEYDYITYQNQSTDAWARGTTYTSGMVEFPSSSNASMTGVGIDAYCNIIFGAENKNYKYIKDSNAGRKIGYVNSKFTFHY